MSPLPLVVVALETDGFTWVVETPPPRAAAAPFLARHRDRLVWVAGVAWANVPVRLGADGLVEVGGHALPAGASWRAVAKRSALVLDAAAASGHAAARALSAAALPDPARVPERAERAAARLYEDWARGPGRAAAAPAWAEHTDGERAPWRRRAAMFLAAVDRDEDPGPALAFAWMTEFENRLAPRWLAVGGWAGEPAAFQEAWRARAAAALAAAGPR